MAKTLSSIFKIGNGQAISVNKTVLNQAGLEIGDNLEVDIQDGIVTYVFAITITPTFRF